MKRRLWVLACSLFLAFALSMSARGDIVLYNNFGPGYSYNPNAGTSLFGPFSYDCIHFGSCQIFGVQFTPLATASLEQIDLAASWLSGTNALTLELALDNNNTPGLILESWNLGPLGYFGQNNPPLTALSLRHPLLIAGVTYDIVAIPANDEEAAWMDNYYGLFGNGV